MKTTQENELRELDCWIAINLFGWNFQRGGSAARYSTDPAAAMAVLAKCLLHVKARQDLGSIVFINGVTAPWIITTVIGRAAITEGAETLPLTIARFAKALFSCQTVVIKP